jgi:hypothetical protein
MPNIVIAEEASLKTNEIIMEKKEKPLVLIEKKNDIVKITTEETCLKEKNGKFCNQRKIVF